MFKKKFNMLIFCKSFRVILELRITKYSRVGRLQGKVKYAERFVDRAREKREVYERSTKC